jgi:hypothetical protein
MLRVTLRILVIHLLLPSQPLLQALLLLLLLHLLLQQPLLLVLLRLPDELLVVL